MILSITVNALIFVVANGVSLVNLESSRSQKKKKKIFPCAEIFLLTSQSHSLGDVVISTSSDFIIAS